MVLIFEASRVANEAALAARPLLTAVATRRP